MTSTMIGDSVDHERYNDERNEHESSNERDNPKWRYAKNGYLLEGEHYHLKGLGYVAPKKEGALCDEYGCPILDENWQPVMPKQARIKAK